MGLLQNYIYRKMSATVRDNPQGAALVARIENYGTFDGSVEGLSKAAWAMSCIESQHGRIENSRTMEIFNSTMRNSNLPIPLAAIYAYTVGECLENPYFVAYNLDTEQARSNAQASQVFFPKYREYVNRRHSSHDAFIIFCKTTQYLEVFL